MPGIGGSLFLIALGAILKWAVTVNNPHGFNINTAGIILLIVGAVGLVVSVIWMLTQRKTNVVQQTPMGASRPTYNEPPPAGY
jgi:hypothetical protein